MRKQSDLNIVVVPGMHLEDPAWKKEREIATVTLNLEQGYYYIGLKEHFDNCPNKDACEKLKQVYEGHG